MTEIGISLAAAVGSAGGITIWWLISKDRVERFRRIEHYRRMAEHHMHLAEMTAGRPEEREYHLQRADLYTTHANNLEQNK